MRRLLLFLSVLCLTLTASLMASAQSSAPLLSQVLQAVGGPDTIGTIQDFTTTGTITYFWAGEPVEGTVTIRARGTDEFRLDAVLPDGTRSWATSRGQGALQDTDGTVSEIPAHNVVNLGIMTYPYINIYAALGDPLVTVTDMGLAQAGAIALRQIRVQRSFSSESDPGGMMSKLCVTDYFIDPATGWIVQSVDMTHPASDATTNLTHEVDFGNYSRLDGYTVPLTITEKINGQTTQRINLTNYSFNTGVSDLSFLLQ